MQGFANADSSIKEPSYTAFVRNESRGKKRRLEDPNVIEICTLARHRAGSRHLPNQSDAMTKMFRVTAPMGFSSQKFWSFT
jgi:hypothetical protein